MTREQFYRWQNPWIYIDSYNISYHSYIDPIEEERKREERLKKAAYKAQILLQEKKVRSQMKHSYDHKKGLQYSSQRLSRMSRSNRGQ